ncbi:7-cyano-7-deazaguanine synthase [Vibrio owensii]|uniref:7-cyano-7-deazaguanine synthase n=1 Tax=Vibrio owensii TaxID=696485 RepID=UPI003390DC95
MKIVVLVSGGMDSTILTHYTKLHNPDAEVVLLHFDYGHPFEHKERKTLPEGTIIRKFDWLNPNEPYPIPEEDPAHLPGRDFAMIAQAMIQEDPDRIYLGLLHDEMNSYLDQSYEFYYRLNHLLRIVSPSGKRVEVEAPLEAVGLNKLKAVQWALDNGMTIEELNRSSSCMHHEDKRCGRCPVCMKRWAIFELLGHGNIEGHDPFESVDIVKDFMYRIEGYAENPDFTMDFIAKGIMHRLGTEDRQVAYDLLTKHLYLLETGSEM